MNKKYSTLLFDADNTLLDFSTAEHISLVRTMKNYGVPVNDDNIRAYVDINNSLWKRLEKKEITKPELKQIRFRLFFDTIGFGFSGDTLEVNEHYLELLSQCGYTMSGATELAEKLFLAGYEIYIITNGIAKTQAQRLKKSGLLPFVKEVFVSEAVGFPKPDKRFFEHVLQKIPEKDKNKIMVIGDSLSSDILGAANAGLDCIWLNAENTALPEGYRVDYTVNSLKELENIFL